MVNVFLSCWVGLWGLIMYFFNLLEKIFFIGDEGEIF